MDARLDCGRQRPDGVSGIMKTECMVYTFRADERPHGIIHVARVTQSDSRNPHDIMIDFPKRYLEEHPHCQELMGMAGVEYIDDRSNPPVSELSPFGARSRQSPG